MPTWFSTMDVRGISTSQVRQFAQLRVEDQGVEGEPVALEQRKAAAKVAVGHDVAGCVRNELDQLAS
jgi:hypothetical protein